jgi:pimeloyl-ACP methyl ester carboxylesterase
MSGWRPWAAARFAPTSPKYAGDSRRGRRDMLAATPALGAYEQPLLIALAAKDRIMPLEHGRRLGAAFPAARLVEIPSSYTLVPIDQPQALARHLRDFVAEDLAAPIGDPRASG